MEAKVVQLSSDHSQTHARRWKEITGNQLFLKPYQIKQHWTAYVLMWHLQAVLKQQLGIKTQKSIAVFHLLNWNIHFPKWETLCPCSRSGKICLITATTQQETVGGSEQASRSPLLLAILISVPLFLLLFGSMVLRISLKMFRLHWSFFHRAFPSP